MLMVIITGMDSPDVKGLLFTYPCTLRSPAHVGTVQDSLSSPTHSGDLIIDYIKSEVSYAGNSYLLKNI